MTSTERPRGVRSVVVVFVENEVPAIEAVFAAVGDDVAGEPLAVLPRMGQQVRPAAAVDARDDGGGREHRVKCAARSVRTLRTVRIVAGAFRGRRLASPPGDETRPTTDKVREAVFNALVSIDAVHGATVVDLFAGTGALGLEALSRGAVHATFVERGRPAVRALRDNVATLGVADRAVVMESDAMGAATRLGHHIGSAERTLVFADPPYGFDRWDGLFDALAGWDPAPLVVAESGSELALPVPWEIVRSKRYGRTWVAFCSIPAK